MRTLPRILLVPSVGIVAILAPGLARAQVDINPPLPNVLLLIDTSGSMENMPDGKRVEQGTKCAPGTATPMNRWATLVSALTGSIRNFSCYAEDRSSTEFRDEYTFDGAIPYDYQYYLPFHRLLSNGCTAGPGSVLPTTPATYFGWPAGGIKYHPFNDAAAACSTGWAQADDGVLDVYKDRARFGLMTFDTLSDPGTGASGTLLPIGSTGMAGMWSYYLNWQASGAAQTGQLPGCTAVTFEVGARNPAAPPWEGRLIPFGAFDAPLASVAVTNDHIQEALVAMRPYGATPLAGMLQDARDFLLADTSTDPSTSQPFGPYSDPYIVDPKGCRKTVIVVLSDGEPNMDMREQCASISQCPYRYPYEIAHELATLPADHEILTYTVGFGLSSESGTDCNLLTPSDLTAPGGLCATTTSEALRACCQLGRIAFEGGTKNARFADDTSTLVNVMNDILTQVTGSSTSRTFPVFASGTANSTSSGNTNAPANAYQFVSSFDAPPNQLWSGNLERKRYECKTVNGTLQAVLDNIDPLVGDDFAANVNSGSGDPRRFMTMIHDDITIAPDTDPADPTKDDVKTRILSQFSIRPKLTTDDGLGLLSGTLKLGDAALVVSAVGAKPETMDFVPMPTACTQPFLGPSTTSADCAQKVMNWELGEPNAQSLPSRAGNELGSIYHSIPALVGTPRDFLRDESYSQFALAQVQRALMLYTGTTDGQLHAFKVASNKANESGLKVDTKTNNERWSMLPPYVLPKILAQYDHAQQFLLDGPPIIKDVVFHRTGAQAIAGGDAVSGARWNTVLVGGGGTGGGYYYAIDITDPENPDFLWQLSTDNAGRPLFGKRSGTPAITTITLKEGSVNNEVAVAILPGGYSNGPVSASCTRRTGSFSYIEAAYAPRSAVRCWNKNAARSLTIVRLDTGAVLMSFRGDPADGPSSLTQVKHGIFDSPVSGVPVPYPSQPGQVANRVYVGDSDGTLWRIDLSDPDPANWSAKLAWDAYSISGDVSDSGQPIQTPPIVSVDTIGNTVVLFSTGDQELLTASTGVNTRVWSFLEKPVFSSFSMKANWFIPFVNGKRVTGPISLFNSVAYFATFTPASGGGSVCDSGSGSIWGVDYIQSSNPGGGPRPLPRFVADPVNAPTTFISEQPQADGTIVFGVAVTQTPSCSVTDVFTDPYLGSHTAVSSVSEGEFQLVYQTGKVGTKLENSKTNTKTQTLPRPRESTRIDSWASIVE